MAIAENISDRAFTIILDLFAENPLLDGDRLHRLKSWMAEYKADLEQRERVDIAMKATVVGHKNGDDKIKYVVPPQTKEESAGWARKTIRDMVANKFLTQDEGDILIKPYLLPTEDNNGMDQRG